MKISRKVELKPGSYEEELPGISAEFPYIASYVELDKYAGIQSPWHWHKEAELFYMEQGGPEYDTPQGRTAFTAGSGGFVNLNHGGDHGERLQIQQPVKPEDKNSAGLHPQALRG